MAIHYQYLDIRCECPVTIADNPNMTFVNKTCLGYGKCTTKNTKHPNNKIPGRLQAFFFVTNWDNPHHPNHYLDEFLTYLKKLFKEEKVGHTTIGLEISKTSHKEYDGQHVHVMTWMKDQTYHTMSIALFKKWGLRGRALPQKPRQYGKLKHIKDPDKMYAYTIKQRRIISTYELNDLKTYLDICYETEDNLTEAKEVVLKHFQNDDTVTIDDIAIFIINYYRSKGWKCPTMSFIKNIFLNFRYNVRQANGYCYDAKSIWYFMKNQM